MVILAMNMGTIVSLRSFNSARLLYRISLTDVAHY